MNKEEQSTVAKYYKNLIGDFETNELKIMAELDSLENKANEGKKGKKKSDMKGAVEGTEEIRKWQYHMWDR